MNKKLILFFTLIIISTVLTCTVDQPLNEDTYWVDDSKKEINIPDFATLSDDTPKPGLPSTRESARKAAYHAVKYGHVKNTVEKNKEDTLKPKDFIFIEDNNHYDNDNQRSRDYYYASAVNSKGLIVVCAKIYAKDGEAGMVAWASSGGADDAIAQKSDIAAYARNNSILQQSSVKIIKAELIRSKDNYHPIFDWSWVVILDKQVSTKSGQRRVFLIDPQVYGAVASRSMQLIKETLPNPERDSRLSVFSTEADEAKYLGVLDEENGFNVDRNMINQDAKYEITSLD